ncbi:MAG: hypothetical protein E7515_03385 [Ruminococcaceae bacterium]|jgi:vacuolar-type H+-ATPase subunit H|nr:hypothetical protein [Oscillospiraceae bacterium]
MAKEILDAVRNAEKESEGIVLEAQNKAKELIDEAERKADELISSSADAAKTKADSFLTSVKEENKKQINASEEKALGECEKLRSVAEKNRQSVIIKAVEKFF